MCAHVAFQVMIILIVCGDYTWSVIVIMKLKVNAMFQPWSSDTVSSNTTTYSPGTRLVDFSAKSGAEINQPSIQIVMDSLELFFNWVLQKHISEPGYRCRKHIWIGGALNISLKIGWGALNAPCAPLHPPFPTPTQVYRLGSAKF